MNEDAVNKQLRELIYEIADPSKNRKKLAISSVEETQPTPDKIDQSLIDLRICVKYLLFDVEATRRERDRLKTILDNQPPSDDDTPNKADDE